ncbi:MAG: tRNA (adenosine(37)-N6)-threonylcarbamoyltransferase complex ATPase subunit type 1 TsaE [Oscillospiraceae bacterium]|jgi:tRNA threonylcarbamoyladenosine biosynthesis protein TsaE|nr:tRNA (adenosine(37)-N6)-threonylcarbamoyltransferase complex ATPase subunit type 1 TsaE [Oscillospiraceae bacterium]
MIAHSASQTEDLGRRLGALLRAGDVVLLSGGLGAGKSVLARGIARGMGVTEAVPSPTFTLMNRHSGAVCALYHMDLYRLEGADALREAGLDEYIGGDGVAVIEWPQRAPEAMPPRRLEIEIARAEDDDARHIRWAAAGGFPPAVLQALGEGNA